jgi:sialate O-acetylesterase
MVLQRDREYEIWGREAAAASVTVEIDGISVSAAVNGGRFRAALPPHPAGICYTMTVHGSETLVVSDICFGDVFLFSGQSNFELQCSRVLDVSAEEIAAADYPFIREYKVIPSYRFDCPEEEVLPAFWRKAQGSRVYGMSAAAFFFAKELYETKKIPVGIIVNAVGGSRIEAWLPEEEVIKLPGCAEKIAPFKVKGSLQKLVAGQDEEVMAWRRSITKGFDCKKVPEQAKRFYLPGLTANTELKGFSGSVWFSKEVFLEKAPEGEGLLYLGEMIDSDETYINGVKGGETGYRYPPRKYRVMAGLLRAGNNLISVRLVIMNGAGGFVPEHPYYLEAGGVKTELSGMWNYAIETSCSPAPPHINAPNLPTGLYHSSAAPLKGLQFKGVLWYQGESDVYEPGQYLNYADKLAALVKCWRKLYKQDFGFICVELADYIDPIDGVLPGWATIQKAQREAPLCVSNCMAVSAKDLGAMYELHPQYKKELGLRLAAAAEKLFYT